MKASEFFFEKTHKRCLYNITLIENVSSIIENGILCYNSASKVPHTSIASIVVQRRRNLVQVPNGHKLHCYANLYFSFHNPMLYIRKDQAETLCILAVSSSVLDIDGCVVTDRNAASDFVKFYSPDNGIEHIDFEKVFAKYWTHDNPYEQMNHKSIKCAEVLVPYKISYDLVVGAYVVSEEAQQRLVETGFDRRIVVNSSVFFN